MGYKISTTLKNASLCNVYLIYTALESYWISKYSFPFSYIPKDKSRDTMGKGVKKSSQRKESSFYTLS